MGSNLSFLRSKPGINFQSHSFAHCIKMAPTVEQLDCQSNCLTEQLWILLRTRCNQWIYASRNNRINLQNSMSLTVLYYFLFVF